MTQQENIGKIAIALLIIFIITINVFSYTIYMLYPNECFSNPDSSKYYPEEIN